jgi:predicted PurR-regulated permease PerM
MTATIEPHYDENHEPAADVRANPSSVALTVLAVIGVIAAVKFAEVILVPVVLAVLISYALDPAVTLLHRARIPRALAATLLLGAFLAAVVGGGYALRGQVIDFVEELPTVAHRLGEALQARGNRSPVGKVQQAAGEIEKAATAATRPTTAASGARPVQVQQPPVNIRDYLLIGSIGVAGLVGQIIVVVFLALYLLAAGDLFKRKLVHIVGPSLSSKKITVQILEEIDHQIALFLLVRLAISTVVGVATGVALALVGLHNAVLWGVAAGLLNAIPYLGPAAIAAAAALAGFLQFDTILMAVVTSGATLVVATFEGYWLTPWLTGRASQMNAVAVFVGVLFWGWLWGVWGMLLSVPLLMVTKAVCDRVEDLQAIGELLGE